MKKIFITVTLTLFSYALPARAVDFSPTVGVSYEYGGDNLMNVNYTDGSSESIKGGEGFQLHFGTVATLNEAESLFATLTLGWKYVSLPDAENGDASLARYPLEGIFYYRDGKHRFGAGVTKHMNISYSTSGILSGYGTDLESKVGTILAYGYSFEEDDQMSLGIKYTDLTYTATDYNVDIDAGSLGIFWHWGF